jgi:hypothetical protein
MSYESDIASGRFVPSQKALEADAFIASTSPETHPDKYTFLGTMGWVYTGPERFDTSRTEHTGWVNRNLGFSGFGGRAGAFTDIYDDPDPQPASQPPSFNYMTDEELADYNEANDTNFSGNYLSTHPQTGEAGMWTWDPQAGWRDDTQWIGPRTHYEDGTPITSFEDVRDGVFDDSDETNQYGDPVGTVYSGGTPCFDEKTGTYDRSIPGCENAGLDSDEDQILEILPMCYDTRAINYGESGLCKFPPATEDPSIPTDGTTTPTPPFVNIGSPVGGAFTGMAPQGLSYSATALPSTAPAPSVKNVDYVKLLRGWLTNSLFKDMI